MQSLELQSSVFDPITQWQTEHTRLKVRLVSAMPYTSLNDCYPEICLVVRKAALHKPPPTIPGPTWLRLPPHDGAGSGEPAVGPPSAGHVHHLLHLQLV